MQISGRCPPFELKNNKSNKIAYQTEAQLGSMPSISRWCVSMLNNAHIHSYSSGGASKLIFNASHGGWH